MIRGAVVQEDTPEKRARGWIVWGALALVLMTALLWAVGLSWLAR